jgi:hypothetical protein
MPPYDHDQTRKHFFFMDDRANADRVPARVYTQVVCLFLQKRGDIRNKMGLQAIFYSVMKPKYSEGVE